MILGVTFWGTFSSFINFRIGELLMDKDKGIISMFRTNLALLKLVVAKFDGYIL